MCGNDSIQGFALYTGTLPFSKCRYATEIQSGATETVPGPSSIDGVGANVEDAIIPRRFGRTRATPEWYGNLVCTFILI